MTTDEFNVLLEQNDQSFKDFVRKADMQLADWMTMLGWLEGKE